MVLLTLFALQIRLQLVDFLFSDDGFFGLNCDFLLQCLECSNLSIDGIASFGTVLLNIALIGLILVHIDQLIPIDLGLHQPRVFLLTFFGLLGLIGQVLILGNIDQLFLHGLGLGVLWRLAQSEPMLVLLFAHPLFFLFILLL